MAVVKWKTYLVLVFELLESLAFAILCLVVLLLAGTKEDSGWLICDDISFAKWTCLERKTRAVDQEFVSIGSGEALRSLIEAHVFTKTE